MLRPAGLHQGHGQGIQGHPCLGNSTELPEQISVLVPSAIKTCTGVQSVPGNVLRSSIRKEERDLNPG